jgi:8-oxo-dGTP pyrophosphatase MutT (NUDIX family)
MSPSEPPVSPAAAERPRPRGLVREPHLAPVEGTDAHLPAVPPERLQPEALRARFAPTLLVPVATAVESGPGAWAPEFAGDDRLTAGLHPRPAAVLVPLVRRQGGLAVLLTRRTAHLNDHAGQISFPGGRTDPEDADAIATALREAHEEVGLRPEEIEVIGRLPLYTTVTGYAVTPVVGLLEPPRALVLDAFEVAEAFEVPLAFLMDPAHHRRHVVEVQQLTRRFLSMPWRRDAASDEYFIWGATAAMIRNLYRFLA